MNSFFPSALLLVPFIIIVIVTSSPSTFVFTNAQLPPPVPGFMCGVSDAPFDIQTSQNLQRNLHATHVRRYIMWKYAQPTVSKKTFEYNLTVAAVKANPAKYIDQWSATVPKWALFDKEISSLCSQMKSQTGTPITPILEVFEGTVTGVPVFEENRTQFVDPCTVGTEAYLAHSYRWVRAVTKRYTRLLQETCNAPSPIFQIENEFNEAALSVFYGQRKFCLQWFNWTFLTQSLSTLRDAVKDESPSVRVTQNLHTDVPKSVHDLLHLQGFYVDAAHDWDSLIDIWSLDSYPNMIIADPLLPGILGDRIANVTAVTFNKKEVFIMETGFPRLDENVTPLPPSTPTNWSVLDFTPEKQARYSELAIETVVAARGAGIFFFHFEKSNGMQPPEGGYLNQDLELFGEVQKFLLTNNITQFVHWAFEPFTNHLTTLLDRAGVYLHRADTDDGWALMEKNGTATPAFNSIAKLYRTICG